MTHILSFITLILALAAAGSAAPTIVVREPLVALPMSRRSYSPNGKFSVVEHDRARIRRFKEQSSLKKRAIAESMDIVGGMNYGISVGVGSPPTNYHLLVDTGSSNSWINGVNPPYIRTGTSKATGQAVSASYGGNQTFHGKEYIDTVTVGNHLTISAQSIGVASTLVDFDGSFYVMDGILGIGPTGLTNHTLWPGVNSVIPTVTDNLRAEGSIGSTVVGIYFQPQTAIEQSNGEIVFGGFNQNKMSTEPFYTPITSTQPAAQCWGIEQDITYGNTTILKGSAGTVDTGTTLLVLADDAFRVYQELTNATLDERTGLLTVPSVDNLQNMTFAFGSGNPTLQFTPNAQIWPRVLNYVIGGDPEKIYLVVVSSGEDSGSGYDFINGQVFLERFYSIYDTDNQRVGFAETAHTYDETN